VECKINSSFISLWVWELLSSIIPKLLDGIMFGGALHGCTFVRMLWNILPNFILPNLTFLVELIKLLTALMVQRLPPLADASLWCH
jgi:hypothetical protein